MSIQKDNNPLSSNLSCHGNIISAYHYLEPLDILITISIQCTQINLETRSVTVHTEIIFCF